VAGQLPAQVVAVGREVGLGQHLGPGGVDGGQRRGRGRRLPPGTSSRVVGGGQVGGEDRLRPPVERDVVDDAPEHRDGRRGHRCEDGAPHLALGGFQRTSEIGPHRPNRRVDRRERGQDLERGRGDVHEPGGRSGVGDVGRPQRFMPPVHGVDGRG
jgi:hypothetical protein